MKRFRIILLLITIFSLGGASYDLYDYYSSPKLREPYLSNKGNDTIDIAYIGDSWAFFHNEHNCMMAKLLEDSIHRPIKVYSMGICGLTSKEIYESIFEDIDLRNFFRQRKYDYCFVSAGINDTYKKMSAAYYQKSMEGIIQFLLANNIRPIILEIPDYDILKTYKNQKIEKKLLRRLSMFINSTGIDCKQDFRNALNELIKKKDYNDSVSIIRYKTWNNNFDKDIKSLYLKDGMHLNEYGYNVLDSAIAEEIKHNLSISHARKYH